MLCWWPFDTLSKRWKRNTEGDSKYRKTNFSKSLNEGVQDYLKYGTKNTPEYKAGYTRLNAVARREFSKFAGKGGSIKGGLHGRERHLQVIRELYTDLKYRLYYSLLENRHGLDWCKRLQTVPQKEQGKLWAKNT